MGLTCLATVPSLKLTIPMISGLENLGAYSTRWINGVTQEVSYQFDYVPIESTTTLHPTTINCVMQYHFFGGESLGPFENTANPTWTITPPSPEQSPQRFVWSIPN